MPIRKPTGVGPRVYSPNDPTTPAHGNGRVSNANTVRTFTSNHAFVLWAMVGIELGVMVAARISFLPRHGG
jgi:hypothetical protein